MRGVLTALVTTAAAVTLAAGVPGPASGASAVSRWQAEPVTLPAGSGGYDLPAVSCTTATSCLAVVNNAPAAVEQWNGSTWTGQLLPDPGNASFLNAISCASPTACTAVGYYINYGTNHYLGLAEEWNGSTWTYQALPPPKGQSEGRLTAVSCPAAANCIAIGERTATVNGKAVPVAEHWNGSTWTARLTAPLPAGATGAQLGAISCPSVDFCMATGYATGLNTALAELWNGSTWTSQSVPAGIAVGGVSCSSASSCMGIGTSGSSGTNFLPHAAHWNGSAWQATPVPLPPGGKNGTLAGLSCTSATRCTAVGWWNKGLPTGRHTAWAVVWNGTTWRYQPTAQPATQESLLGVSCTAARTCTAVVDNKQSGDHALVEHESGTSPGGA